MMLGLARSAQQQVVTKHRDSAGRTREAYSHHRLVWLTVTHSLLSHNSSYIAVCGTGRGKYSKPTEHQVHFIHSTHMAQGTLYTKYHQGEMCI